MEPDCCNLIMLIHALYLPAGLEYSNEPSQEARDCLHNDGLKLSRRRRRWTNFKPPLGQRVVFFHFHRQENVHF